MRPRNFLKKHLKHYSKKRSRTKHRYFWWPIHLQIKHAQLKFVKTIFIISETKQSSYSLRKSKYNFVLAKGLKGLIEKDYTKLEKVISCLSFKRKAVELPPLSLFIANLYQKHTHLVLCPIKSQIYFFRKKGK